MPGRLIATLSPARRTRSLARLVALGIAFASTSAAFGESLACQMDAGAQGRYIAREIRLDWDAFGDATVDDAVIAGTGRPSVRGQIVPGSPTKLVATWQVRGVTPDPLEQRRGDANLVVRLTVQRASGSAVITVSDASTRKYSYRAAGSCRFGA